MDDDGRSAFALDLAARRKGRGLSLAGLAADAHVHRGYLHKVETGQRWPAEQVVLLLDDVLRAHGVLLAAWRSVERERLDAAAHSRSLAASVRESHALDALLDDVPLGESVTAAEQAAAALAVDYLRSPPAPMLTAASKARAAVVRDLGRAPSSSRRRVLIRAGGYLSGVLAYAALDLDHPDEAAQHAATAYRCGQVCGDPALSGWARGTQSLVARFGKDYPTALALADAGRDDPGPGTGAARLLAGMAQSAANLGDRAAAHQALSAAEHAADRAGSDAFGGLFTFSHAKLAYYGGSALIWLDQPADARRAVGNATTAIRMWQTGDPDDRSLDDEALAHVYAATGHVQLAEVDAAAAMLALVLTLPAERRIPWLCHRVTRVGELLTARRFAHSTQARELLTDVQAFSSG